MARQQAAVLLPLLLLLLLLALYSVAALHEDRAGKEDWLKQHVGRVIKAAPTRHAVVVASEQGAIAGLSLQNGDIQWRHVFPSSSASHPIVDLVVEEAKGLVLVLSREEPPSSPSSSDPNSGSILHCWAYKLKSGRLQWHAPLSSSLPAAASSSAFVGLVTAGEVVMVADGDGFVSLLDATKGQLLWEWAEGLDKMGTVAGVDASCGVVVGEDTTHSKPLAFRLSSSLSSTSSSYSFTPLPTPSVVTTPTALTTALKNMHTYHAFPRPSGHGILLLLTTTEEEQRVLLLMGACVPGVKSAVQSPIVGAGSLLSSSLLPLLLQMEGGAIAALDINKEGGKAITPILLLPENDSSAPIPAAVAGGFVLYATGEGKVEGARATSGERAGSIDLPAASGGSHRPLRHIFPASSSSPLFLCTTAADVTLLLDVEQWPVFTVRWRREEALSGVEAVGFLDYVSVPSSVGEEGAAVLVPEKEVRFGLAKVVALLCPKSQRMVGMLTAKGGRVIWTRDLEGDDWTMAVSRAAYDHRHHHTHVPELLLVSSAKAEAVWVDGMTGRTVGQPLDLAVPKDTPLLVTPLLSPPTDEDDGRTRVLVVELQGRRGRVLVGPSQGQGSCVEEEGKPPLHYHQLDGATGRLQTYRLLPCSNNNPEWPLSSVEMGVAALPPGEEVLAVAYPDPLETTASPAHILGDHALLLKHLNPHTVALASTVLVPAASENGTDAGAMVPTLHITVMDTVSARTLHRLTHFHGRGPVSLRLVENWLVYSYWNTKAQRSELGSVSYYNGYIDKTALSPFKRPDFKAQISSLDGTEPPPLGLQQSFVFPRPVLTIGSTLTAQGITSKALLLGFAPGQILSLDRRFLDPRRPVLAPGKKPTAAEAAEGLVPYQLHVPLLPTHVLSYNRTIEGLRRIHTAPSKLESTSLVLAVGLDLFFTRVTPSKPFDLLSEEFNHVMVSLVLLAVVGSAWFLGRKVRSKRLRDCWA